MTGKNKCKILKDIRRQIAENNDIELIIEECTYKGECRGTCPRCEAELRYLEAELLKRKNAGKSVAVAGLAAVMLAASGCANEPIQNHTVSPDSTSLSFSSEEETKGAIPVIYDESSDNSSSGYELEGDVAYPSQHPEVRGAIPAPITSSVYEEPTDEGVVLDIDYILNFSEAEKEEFLKEYDAKSLKEAWCCYSNVKPVLLIDTKLYFAIEHSSHDYILCFFHDENGIFTDLIIYEDGKKFE